MGVESYKHQFAKITLAKWLREAAELAGGYDEYVNLSPLRWRVNRGANHYGVWVEYPICLNSKNDIVGYGAWDEEHQVGDLPTGIEYTDRPPTYDEVIDLGLVPIVIFDVAIQHKGNIAYGLEVVHRNGISDLKLDYLYRVNIPTYTIDADWILSRVKRPDVLVCQQVI